MVLQAHTHFISIYIPLVFQTRRDRLRGKDNVLKLIRKLIPLKVVVKMRGPLKIRPPKIPKPPKGK